MGRDPRVDSYIAAAAPFAREILERLRAIAHAALPDAQEAIKWGMPHFLVNGKNVAGMAAFKAHCSFVIHGDGRQGDAMGQYGRIATLADIPDQADLAASLATARARVLDRGTALKPAARAPRPELPMPPDFAETLDGSPPAATFFATLAPGQRREYVEWITEAKTAGTRAKRIAQSVEWLAEGRRRNWKYEKR